jgi:AcrR family transcriptional regulator
LKAAVERLASGGYDRMTLEEVAGDVGITRGGIYRYFSTKPELARAAVLGASRGSQVTEELFLARVQDAKGLREELRAFVLACVQQTLEDPQPTVRFFELGDLAEHDEVLAEHFRKQAQYVRERVRGLVEAGAERGELATDADAEDVIESVLGLIWVMSKGAATAPSHRIRDQVAMACDLLLQDPPWLSKAGRLIK